MWRVWKDSTQVTAAIIVSIGVVASGAAYVTAFAQELELNQENIWKLQQDLSGYSAELSEYSAKIDSFIESQGTINRDIHAFIESQDVFNRGIQTYIESQGALNAAQEKKLDAITQLLREHHEEHAKTDNSEETE